MVDFFSPVSNFPYITSAFAKKLAKLEIFTARDIFFHFPSRYEDYSQITPIVNANKNQTITVQGKITHSKTIRTWKKRMFITEIIATDKSGHIRAIWFNQPHLIEQFQIGKEIRLSGKITEGEKGFYFSNPAWEFSRREPTHTGRLVPVYPETKGITSRWLRWQLQNLFKLNLKIPESIPSSILAELNLPNLKTALRYIHFPENEKQYLIARKRFAFEEMFFIQLKTLQIKNQWTKEKSVIIPFNPKIIKSFVDNLPFKLTDAQRKSSFEILKDLEKSKPMNRLLNGDVGSGKTIVAAIAILQTVFHNYQAVIMAPTEILAQQHYKNFCDIFKDYNFKISLLTSKNKIWNRKINAKNDKKNKTSLSFMLQNSHIIIGTHALIQKNIKFKKLALIIIDEQHRFGVAQRSYFQKEIEKINDGLPGKIPHFLTMTATPIPRTLALAFFGNLDISFIDEMPKKRKKIITQIISSSQRERIYAFVRQEIKKGRQAFVILPLVEESKILTEVKAAIAEHQRFSEKIFPDLKIGLIHGKIKTVEKEKIMRDFRNKEFDILVATPVIEVGIDIPNASVIIIEDADRFGLTQLHQFRGRVGRGEHQSYCFLFAEKLSANAKKRLQTLVESEDGFKIAEKDLKIRGPGEFFGFRQSGLPDIAMENLNNIKLVQISKNCAKKILLIDPDLKKHPLLKKALEKFEQKTHME